MNAAEIVMREMQADGGFQVRQLLAKGVRQPCEPPAHHTKGEILPFDVAGTYEHGIGGSGDHFGHGLHEAGWRVAFSGFWKATINFDELCEVHFVAECRIHGPDIRPPTIRGQLRLPAPSCTAAHIMHERVGVYRAAFAHEPRENQLCVRVHCDEHVLLPRFVTFQAPPDLGPRTRTSDARSNDSRPMSTC